MENSIFDILNLDQPSFYHDPISLHSSQNHQIKGYSSSSSESFQEIANSGKKSRKKRSINSNSYWNEHDQTMFWIFFLRQIVEKGESQITWKCHLEDRTFVKMGETIGKTRDQCRSFNQRMKNKYFQEGINDLPNVVFKKMKKFMKSNHEKSEEIEKLYHRKKEQDDQRRLFSQFLENNAEFLTFRFSQFQEQRQHCTF